MRNLLNPKWLFLVNTLPIILLFLLYAGQFQIIKSLLDERSIHLWVVFGITLFILALANFIYTIWLTLRKKEVSAWYGVLALLCYVPFVYVFDLYSDYVIPFSIPMWMVPHDDILYVGTFLMPTLAYALFILVAHCTSEKKAHSAGVNISIAIVIPLVWYFFVQVIFPMWRPMESNFGQHIFIVLFVISALAFLFFIVRSIYIIAGKRSKAWRQYELFWKIPISILLPILGLLVNSGFLIDKIRFSSDGVFGDFNNFWFFFLAIANGVFVSLPNRENKIYRLFVFIGRSIGFAYVTYFFFVFLPFLPLSIPAIIAFGVGFLLLTPLALFILQIVELQKDFTYLSQHISKIVIRFFLLAGFLVIPTFITVSYLQDRKTLYEALEYIYNPDYSKSYHIDKNSIRKTIDVLKSHKENDRSFIFTSKLPYLSSYFNWLVLHNMTISDTKIALLEKVFLGGSDTWVGNVSPANQGVNISGISSTSTYDKTQNAWLSWVDLEITCINEDARNRQYNTVFSLPDGCWISDYYLNIGEKREPGILAEKKAALWVYSNIITEQRDPGILYYLNADKIAFRVFPVNYKKIRKTGFQIIHKEPFVFTIDGHSVTLGNANYCSQLTQSTNSSVEYVSVEKKKLLPHVQRKPYLHFLVNASEGKQNKVKDFSDQIEKVIKSNSEFTTNAKISFVDAYVHTQDLNGKWKDDYKNQSFSGGCNFDMAIKKSLVQSYEEHSDKYPVIVFITDTLSSSILGKDYSGFKMTFPESDTFYVADREGDLYAHSFTASPLDLISDTIAKPLSHSVLEYNSGNKNYYLPDDSKSSVVLKNDLFSISDSEIKERNWQSALLMQGKIMSQVLHPETTEKEWLNVVRYSFISKVMTPLTSYMVVENEAQKAILKKKQEQVLSGKNFLDLGEETQRMSEPGLLLMAALLGLMMWLKSRKA